MPRERERRGQSDSKKGMPLGNYTSQFFANVYLNELDKFVKHKLKAKYYIRYVDDFVILHDNKNQLLKWKNEIDKFLKESLKINLHKDKTKILPLHKGIGFLGFRVFFNYKLLKKINIFQIKRNLRKWGKLYSEEKISRSKLVEKLQGWFAHVRHGNTYGLRKQVAREFNKIVDPKKTKSKK